MNQRELFREQPNCPACGSTDLRREADDRHQCVKCLWRCIVSKNGQARDWLTIGTAGTRPTSPAKNFRP